MTSAFGNIRQQCTEFFIARLRSPIVSEKTQGFNRPVGWLQEFRADAFGESDFGDLFLKEGSFWSKIRAKIYSLESIGELSAILAYYDDGTVLWLDDHSSDRDFELFVDNERLWKWLPERKDYLIALLLETKLNYLGRPQLINTVSEIPSFSEQEIVSWFGDPRAQNQMVEAQRKLEGVSEKIIPPVLLAEPNGIFELIFFVWTKIMGRLVQVRFKFGQNSVFLFEGDELVKMVGRFIVPR